MRLTRVLRMAAITLASMASVGFADPLADMAGTWRGQGWAKETVQSAQETLRCRIANTYTVATLTLTVKGQCAVPGRQLTLSGTLTGVSGTERITGQWSNPDGIGQVRVVGLQRDGIVAFNFGATDLATGQQVSQNVEWRISGDQLRMRSTDRANPLIQMSDVTFAR